MSDLTNATRIRIPQGLTREQIDEWLRDSHPEMGVRGFSAYVWRSGGHVLSWVPGNEVAEARKVAGDHLTPMGRPINDEAYGALTNLRDAVGEYLETIEAAKGERRPEVGKALEALYPTYAAFDALARAYEATKGAE